MSNFMRNYCKEQHISFPDFERGTIIWNSNLMRKDKRAALREIAGTTSDETLKEKIEERLLFEAEIERRFAQNSEGNYIFAISFDNENRPSAYFYALNSPWPMAESTP